MRTGEVEWPNVADGVTLTDLSWMTGISVSNLSAYRSGAKHPAHAAAGKVSTAAASTGVIASSHLLSIPRLGLSVKRLHAEDEVYCTQLVRQSFDQLAKHVHHPDDIAAYLIEPPGTRHRGWDLLLRGLAAHMAAFKRVSIPQWAKEPGALPQPWSPGNMPERRLMWDLINTPQSFRERNVVFNRNWLISV